MRHNVVTIGVARHERRYPLHRRRVAALLGLAALALVIFGAALDLGHHTGVPGFTADTLGTTGHLVTLAGMVLTTTAVVLAAALRPRL